MAPRAELVRMLLFEERFALAVSNLLSPVRAYRRATMVPDDGRRADPNAIATREQAPTDIDVISRLREDRIEAADLVERPFAERHVAARNVLRRPVVQHDVRGPARRAIDALGQPWVFRRYRVRPADRDHVGLLEGRGQVGKPVGVGPRVG